MHVPGVVAPAVSLGCAIYAADCTDTCALAPPPSMGLPGGEKGSSSTAEEEHVSVCGHVWRVCDAVCVREQGEAGTHTVLPDAYSSYPSRKRYHAWYRIRAASEACTSLRHSKPLC